VKLAVETKKWLEQSRSEGVAWQGVCRAVCRGRYVDERVGFRDASTRTRGPILIDFAHAIP
jgi:hypothetical protein